MFIYQDRNFWFVTGFMVYLAASFFLFIEATQLPEKMRDAFWNILLIANITKNILFAVAFSRKETKHILQSFESPFDDSIFEHPYKT